MATARSGLPSAFRSPIATEKGLDSVPVLKVAWVAKLGVVPPGSGEATTEVRFMVKARLACKRRLPVTGTEMVPLDTPAAITRLPEVAV